MIPPLPVSVIVVSRDRPAALRRCLMALRLQDHPAFELVVVADAAGRGAVGEAGLEGQLRLVGYDAANVSRARNIGIAAAAGEILAFLDDDAVPEPGWLTRLVAAFEDPRVEAATGFVRGRNGISWQNRASWVDATGRARPLDVDPEAISLHQGAPGSAVKTEGTNMAFRRETLAAMGGFDPAFRFYMDETDLNMRLAAEELVTAVVPRAEVHHLSAGSERRGADRVPRSLVEIGASSAVFLRKHAPGIDPAGPLAALMRSEERRLMRHMVSGGLEPRDVGRLLAGLEAGIAEGLAREIDPLLPIGPPPEEFRPLPGTGPRPVRLLSGWIWQGPGLARAAAAQAAAGAVVTVVRLSPTPAYHRLRFTDQGYWLQTGGVWGRSLRQRPLVQPWRMRSRVRAEATRLAAARPVDTLIG
jgi:GT2 family glycosyltransferase